MICTTLLHFARSSLAVAVANRWDKLAAEVADVQRFPKAGVQKYPKVGVQRYPKVGVQRAEIETEELLVAVVVVDCRQLAVHGFCGHHLGTDCGHPENQEHNFGSHIGI